MKKISIVIPCFNEEGNILEVYQRLSKVCETQNYLFEFMFIDNFSTDRSEFVLRNIALEDDRVKVILNARNFGAVRSSAHLLKQAYGDAVIGLVADLQDPPESIPEFIKKWEEGYKIVVGIKSESDESKLMYNIRSLYYNILSTLSELRLDKHFSGFCLLDKKIVDVIRTIEDPYPYMRGIISEIGFEKATINYRQAQRKKGYSKYNFYSYYDFAILGITNHSKIPLRLATFSGFILATISMCIALSYFVYKMLYWYSFQLGSAPVVIGLFFFGAVQLFFIGILGEYIGSIHTQVLKRPLVVERERINF